MHARPTVTAARPWNHTTARAAAAAWLIGLAGLGGCYFEGGSMSSEDRFTYVSTTWQPKTISVVDTRTAEVIWSVDVPVGKKLVVDFNKGSDEEQKDPYRPDVMLWDIIEPDAYFGALSNKLRIPPKSARRIDMTLRPAPEQPPAGDHEATVYESEKVESGSGLPYAD